jgi:hypothetical protein
MGFISGISFHLLVVVHDLDIFRPGRSPDEADAPLLVDPDAVLSSPAPSKCLEAVARGHTQVIERLGRVQEHQLA